MEKENLLISELASLTGVELELSSDKICELAVEDRIVVLRYRPDDNDWLCFTVVAEPEDGPGKQMMENALRMNLFGAETLGFHLGLFGKALILSGTAAMDGLTAETFAERILLLARHAGKLAEKMESTEAEETPSEAEIPSPWGSGFMQV